MAALAFAAVVAVVAAGCGGDDGPTNPSTPADQLTTFGTLRFTMNGSRIQLAGDATVNSANSLTLTAEDGDTFRLVLVSPLAVGLRSIQEAGMAAAVFSGPSRGWRLDGPGSAAGSISVEAISPGSVSGRFGLFLGPFGGQTGDLVLSDGVYNLALRAVD